MKELFVLSLLAFSLVREGTSTHLETCDCHEIKDIVNATVQEAVAGLEEKLNKLITKNNLELSQEQESTLTATIESLLKPIKVQLDYHLPPPPPGDSADNPVASCKGLAELNPSAESGYYWIKPDENSAPLKVYCNMSLTCGNLTGGWMRVANLDMRDASQSCPTGLSLTTSPKRVCGITSNGCVSTSYAVDGVEYSHICGRVIGYQFQTPAALYYHGAGIEGTYVYGVSLTHGSVNHRSHIWTFVGASDETTSNPTYKCPCINTNIQTSQYFIGNDYFCDTAQSQRFDHQAVLHPNNPLWDGEGCGPTNACCNRPNSHIKPPWFYKHLSGGTSDDIEMRVCRGDGAGSTPIETVELYVQ